MDLECFSGSQKGIRRMAEPIDIKKLVAYPATPIFWWKSVLYGLGIGMLVFVGWAVWKAYFKKPDSTQTIHAETGSNVKVIQYNERKKTLIPFVEAYVDQRSGNDTLGGGVRGGVRLEW